MRTARTLVATIAAAGGPWRGLTRWRSAAPGIPSSRPNAHHIRPIEVMDARPKSHMAPPMTIAITFAKTRDRLPYTICSTGYASLAVAAMSPPGMLHVRTIRRTQPTTADTATERNRPQAEFRRAMTVASATWAEASYPV